MATSGIKSPIKQKKEETDRDLECPICLTEYKKPKLLPCLHTFCQDCLNKYCDKEDDKISCPLCRSKFCVPKLCGVNKLPDNQFMVRLTYEKGYQEKKFSCDPCKEIGENIKADSFCMECRQSFCHKCTRLHSKFNYANQHKVVSIEEKPTDYELQRLISSYCNKHDNNKLELYCCDCRELVCALCHANDHNKHDCRISHDVARQKKELSENDRRNIEKFRTVASERKQRLVKAKEDFLQQITSTESSLRKSVDTIRKLLDIYEKEMLEELITIKKKKIKELESEKDLEELHYTTLDSFHTYSRMVMERGTDCEIVRAADDLHRRADELIKDQKKKDAMYHDETQLKFIEPMNPMPEDIKKLVGKIVYKPTGKHTAAKDGWLRISPKVNSVQVNILRIAGVTVVDDEIFVVENGQSYVNVYDAHSLTESRGINIPHMTSPEGLAGCSYNKALYIGDYILMSIHRLDLTSNSVTHWLMSENHAPLGVSMTNKHNVLVTVWANNEGKNNLVLEYTNEGQLVRKIRINSEHDLFKDAIHYRARQTIQFVNCYSIDQFVVCHEWGLSAPQGISLMNEEGKIEESYFGYGGGEGGLCNPSSIAIDYNSKHVFVADFGNNRVLMFNTDLTYLGQVHTPPDLRKPSALYFDSSTDRLIVGEGEGGRVLVISSVRIRKKRLGGLRISKKS